MLTLDSSVTIVSPIAKALGKRLKHLGITAVRDLVFYFPFRYEDWSKISPISSLHEPAQTTIRGRVDLIANRRSPYKRKLLTEALISDESGSIRVVWFNQPYLAHALKVGDKAYFSGKVDYDKFGMQMISPAYEKEKAGTLHTARIVPIYSVTRGVTEKQLRFLISRVIHLSAQVADWIPETLRRKFASEMSLSRALQTIHFPEDNRILAEALRRLKFDELLLAQLRIQGMRREIRESQAPVVPFHETETREFVSSLPFQLTNDQRKAAWEIIKDMGKETPMNRLLEGDVGSGKTVVAAIAMLNAALGRFQSVLMAPTEILARQHYETVCTLLKRRQTQNETRTYADAVICVALLTSSQMAISREGHVTKNQLLEEIKSGAVHIVIGTHALLGEKVTFHNLGIAIVDEQHRFGVKQRALLKRRLTPVPEPSGSVRGRAQNETRAYADITDDGESQSGKNEFLFPELSYKIRGCIFAVRRKIGLGHKEIVYQKALEAELRSARLQFEKEKGIEVSYEGKKIGIYRPDFIVDQKIMIELKAVPFIGRNERRQTWTYLKGSSYKVAFLVNFAPDDVQIVRIVYDTARPQRLRPSASVPRKSALGSPHFLSMTATPIPRSLALSMYGDLDLSLIREMPAGRKQIVSKAVDPLNRTKAYEFIRNQVLQGRQVFVICPLIDPSDKLGVKSATEEAEKLRTEVFTDLRVGLLHGRMKSKAKEQVMQEFLDRALDILVSTAVVEVGVDVPNASVMMIEGAERFGLAQLHQFRGRVGRANHQSYCFLFTDSPSQGVAERLGYFVGAHDGFALAEKDLEMRGPGEMYGSSQSGFPEFKLATLKDVELIKEARDAAHGLFEEDSSQEKYPSIWAKLLEWEQSVHLE